MKRKIYKLLSDAKLGLFALAFTVFAGAAYSQAVYTYSYTGGIQTVNLPLGTYKIECWGAVGADGTYYSGVVPNSIAGGRGGYSIGTITVGAVITRYVVVGGKGTNTLTGNNPGGYNGGGNSSSAPYQAGSGGGASHVATATGVLSTLSGNQPAVLIVAGGGGGGGNQSLGGDGGGLNGVTPPTNTQFSNRTPGGGGTQNSGGACYTSGCCAVFGQGGTTTQNLAGGGGGGWYGGCSGDNSTAGGGGSGYIGGVASGTTFALGSPGYIPNPDPSLNGRVVITELCSISLVASNGGSVSTAICSGQSLTLTTNAIGNFSWTTGAVSSSIVVSPTSNTVYGLTATSPSNCTASAGISVTVSSGLPVLSINTSTNSLCLGKSATLTASGAITYTWSGGVQNGLAYFPPVTQSYTVTGGNGCGTSTAVTTITVAPLAVQASSSPSTICGGSPSTMTVSAAATGFTWTPFPAVLTGTMVTLNPSVTTIYTVIASDGTCAGTATVAINALPIPTVGIAANNSVVCEGYPVALTATGGVTYTWLPGNANGPNTTVNPTQPSIYTVVASNSLGCTAMAAQIILTNQSPTITISANNTFVCAGNQVDIVATGGTGYVWSNGPITSSITVNPMVTTAYTVTGTSPNNTCTASKSVTITVFTPPLTTSGSQTICSGSNATLTANGADTYLWENGSGANLLIVTPTVNTTYSVTATTNSNNILCSVVGTIMVTVNPKPVITAAATRTSICRFETSDLSAGGGTAYVWVASNGPGGNSANITVTPTIPVLYTYSVTGTDSKGCTNVATVQVKVNPCTGLNQLTQAGLQVSVYPNPSKGEVFVQSTSEISLSLINQLGQHIKTLKLDANNNYKAVIADLSNGIYFITGANSIGTFNQKIIVNK